MFHFLPPFPCLPTPQPFPTLPSLQLDLLEPFKGAWNKLLWSRPFAQHGRNSREACFRTSLFSTHKGDPVSPLLIHKRAPLPCLTPRWPRGQVPGIMSHTWWAEPIMCVTCPRAPPPPSQLPLLGQVTPGTQNSWQKIHEIAVTPSPPPCAGITFEFDKYISCLQMFI